MLGRIYITPADKGGSSPPRVPDGLQLTERWTEPDLNGAFGRRYAWE